MVLTASGLVPLVLDRYIRTHRGGRLDSVQQRGDHDPPGLWIRVLTSPVLRHHVGFLDEIHLLHEKPLLQGDQVLHRVGYNSIQAAENIQ